MKYTSPRYSCARASLATCALLLGAAVAFGQSGSTSSSSSSSAPSRDSSAGQSGTRSSSSSSSDNTSSAGSNYGTTDKSLSGSSSVNSGTNGSTGGSANGSSSWSGQSNTATTSATASDASRAGAPTGRETTASTATTSSGKLGFMDRRFVNKAADSGTSEVALAQLASERATNAEVKSFAQQLVQDHTQVNSELTALATQKSVKLDKEDGKDRFYKRLSNKSGADFDQEFVEHMIDEHESAIKLFEKASTDAKDSDLRSFAAKHLEHLRHHLQTAQSLRASIVPTGRENTSGYEADPSTVRGGANSTNSNTNKASGSDRNGTYSTPAPSPGTGPGSPTDTSASSPGGPSSTRSGGR